MDEFKFAQPELARTGKVDKEEGLILGVSLISTPEAKGHGIKIDRGTIESFYEGVKDKSIKAYYTHDDDNEALDSIGLWENFEIIEDGDYTKLTADFKALESWREHHPDRFDALFELAEKAPEAFGVSAEFFAKRIMYSEEGEELDWDGESEDVFARAVEVNAFSIVAQPSANPTGLFSQPKEVEEDEVDVEEFLSFNLSKTQEELDGANSELKLAKDLNATLTSKVEELEAKIAESEKEIEDKANEVDGLKAELQEWQVKFARQVADMGSDPVEFSSESAPLSFQEQLARCKTWEEKSQLFESNMIELQQNPNWNK